ncbi:putative nucleic acid-binding protein, contains PIN domain [Candidatus Methanoperedens nitroreducens]|uniref:Ribonuclease VapC n=1 Tax=Candidatus Methanoperedens nitratireducens TaxID=1392998 RepID=A0A062VAJ0_9EURY|nr:PIN domain-containing protein [Candidatus Methanoperedens nitroreducens]KCZ73503.1 putative nucleic acid-binding protein, contains PIN domain [Candidatus Methanoperedens nitroreducens]MDJ1422541.1 PIN domain-containing protein [Candidatus Methanoperedens sp.]
MSIADFTDTEIFVDTNIFVYALAKKHRHKRTCEALLSKINQGEIIGFTSSTVVNELFHTILIWEVKLKYGDVDIIRFIKERPDVISECYVAYGALDDVFDSSIVILPLTLEVLQHAKTLSKKYNLLFSDAIHAASCEIYGIKHIASNDRDFDRVDFLKNWKP